MRRIHIGLNVKDLEASVQFYSELFGAAPSVQKDDYAKWMLEDPRINFTMSPASGEAGIDHLGFQVDSDAELGEIAGRLQQAAEPVSTQDQAQCCYALSDKAWSRDPQGVVWENFLSHGQLEIKGADSAPAEVRACCEGTPEEDESTCCA